MTAIAAALPRRGLILGLTAAAVLLATRFQRSSNRLLDVRR